MYLIVYDIYMFIFNKKYKLQNFITFLKSFSNYFFASTNNKLLEFVRIQREKKIRRYGWKLGCETHELAFEMINEVRIKEIVRLSHNQKI